MATTIETTISSRVTGNDEEMGCLLDKEPNA
jgi:hypothetical protein